MLFQKKYLATASLFLFVCTLLFVAGCKQKSSVMPDYQLGNPEVTLLGGMLNEISGICYYDKPGDSSLLAVVDSKEKVFKLEMKIPKLVDHTEKVIAGRDPEDIVKVDSLLFVLLSNGTLREIQDNARDTAGSKTYALPLEGVNDFETLYHDPAINSLILLCKNCGHEKGAGLRTAYRFDLGSRSFDAEPFYTIDKNEVKGLLRDANAKFDPSAAAIHPINKRLYILSSAGNLLVVTDTRGTVFEAYRLNKDDFPQAEGIAFAPNGDMFISNEKRYGEPTLLRLKYQPQTASKK